VRSEPPPKLIERETSSRIVQLVLVSASNSLTKKRSVRANSFQSINRMSSPGMYWRCSAKSSDRPKKGEWCRPLMNPSTTVRDSRSRLEMRARVDGSRNRVRDGPPAAP
jgi:hypothetical protein